MSNKIDNLAITLAERPQGLPRITDFAAENRPLGPRSAGAIRCETLYLSLDPYMRSVIAGNHMGHGVDPGDVIAGEAVARVCESDHPGWPVGCLVRCHSGWQQCSDHSPEALASVLRNASRGELRRRHMLPAVSQRQQVRF